MFANANQTKELIHFGNDSVVIKKYISGIEGGRTLDMSGYPLANVLSGSVVILKADGEYAPMPLVQKTTNTGTTDEPVMTPQFDGEGNPVYVYGTLPEGAKYVGVCYRSVSASNPQCSIMFDGIVNEAIMPFGVETIKSEFSAACPHIIFAVDLDGVAK